VNVITVEDATDGSAANPVTGSSKYRAMDEALSGNFSSLHYNTPSKASRFMQDSAVLLVF